MTIRKGIPWQGKQRNEPLRDKMSRSPGSVPTLEHAAGMGQEAFSGRTAKEKWREHMRENPYKQLPPIERKPDGSLYRMTPTQRKQANALIRRECCCYEDGNCMFLDDGDIHACPQTISFSVCCKWFRWSVLPQIGTLEAEVFRDKELKRCAVCGRVFVPKSNRAKYCPDCAARVHRWQKTESERKRWSALSGFPISSLKPPHSHPCPTKQRYCMPLSCAKQTCPGKTAGQMNTGAFTSTIPSTR